MVVVSHDRYFLNRMVTSIADLGPSGLAIYPGDYDDFLVEREARRELLEARARNQAKQVAEIERFIERFRYKATKARQVQSRVKMLERAGANRAVRPRRARFTFAFPEPPRTGRRVASLRDVHKAYGDKVVYAGIGFEVERGRQGRPGRGPTAPASRPCCASWPASCPSRRGSASWGATSPCTTTPSTSSTPSIPTRTALEELEAVAPTAHADPACAPSSARFSSPGDAVDKKVAVLSGGEKARVALARMLVRPAALLALDEPTNHLDLASREVLEEALAAFPGTIVFISHDRYFINRVATKIVEVEGGVLTPYLGSYDDYREAKAASRADGRGHRGAGAASRPRPRRRPSAHGSSGGPRAAPAPRDDRGGADPRPGGAGCAELTTAFGDPLLYADGERVRAITRERADAEDAGGRAHARVGGTVLAAGRP